MSAAAILTVRCHYCSKERNPREVVYMSGGPVMCWHCLEWHQHALQMLAGQPPPGCQECETPFLELNDCDGRGNVRFSVVPKDGIYQVLCQTCAGRYVQKRADLFGSTEYGYHQLKLR